MYVNFSLALASDNLNAVFGRRLEVHSELFLFLWVSLI